MKRPVQRSGMPDESNVVGQYRLHVERIADGELPRPVIAVVLEVGEDGMTRMYPFGPEQPPRVAIAVLTQAIAQLNADAGH